MLLKKTITYTTLLAAILLASQSIYAQIGSPGDVDGDGIPDERDSCPYVSGVGDTYGGVSGANGCPVDSDGDSVEDGKDRCPFEPGTWPHAGCPNPEEESQEEPTTVPVPTASNSNNTNNNNSSSNTGFSFPVSTDCLIAPTGSFNVNIRASASENSNKIGTFNAGTYREGIGQSSDGQWYAVQEGANIGYVTKAAMHQNGNCYSLSVQESDATRDQSPQTSSRTATPTRTPSRTPAPPNTAVPTPVDLSNTFTSTLGNSLGNRNMAFILDDKIQIYYQGTWLDERISNEATTLLEISPDGGKIAYLVESGELNIYTLSNRSNRTISEINVVDFTWAFDSNNLFVTTRDTISGPNTIYQLNLETGQLIHVQDNAWQVRQSNNGEYLTFETNNGVEVVLVENNVQRVISSNCHTPTFGVDEPVLYFICSNALYKYDSTGLNLMDSSIPSTAGYLRASADGMIFFDDGQSIYQFNPLEMDSDVILTLERYQVSSLSFSIGQ